VSAPWPLSGAATLVLFDPEGVARSTVFKLALEELVLRGVWVIRREPTKGLFGRRGEVLVLEPGRRAVPALVPLPAVDALVRERAERRTVRAVVAAVHPEHRLVGDRLRDEVREDLRARGLLVREEQRRLGGRVPWLTWVRTPEGDRLVQECDARRAALATATPASLAGLLVVLRTAEVAAIRRAAAAGGADDAEIDDEIDVAALDTLGPSFDKAVTAGIVDSSPG